jgi:N-acetylglucosamine malate deacetylase 1
MEKRMEAIKAFRSQFYDPSSTEPETYISSPAFFEGIYARAREMGRYINAQYAEGFVASRPLGVTSLAHLL